MSKSRFMKKFLAILVFGFCNLNICASAAMENEELAAMMMEKLIVPKLIVPNMKLREMTRKVAKVATDNPKFKFTGIREMQEMRGPQYTENQEFIKMKLPVEKLAQEGLEYIKMKSLIEELFQISLTGNSMCDFVILGKLFLETEEQLLETKEQLEETQNVNQAMENKIAELNANIRELQIELDQSTQVIESSQKEEEELRKSLVEKLAQENQEFTKMKSRIEELAQESLTGNPMCDLVILGKSFLETKEQLEKTQNVNQAMENKIRELQIKLDRLIQEIEP
ncbi:MAG: hypothetical protein CfP315_0355 [Candidatus Improbicoccus pseudotrichonymphae]|uniref:Uncharacterized protein n=1 Tax=Candidatus Improbicoccus pseudotrichonymphae TaxID=3033792 RepID=A0AA48I839_9FIRM|nr:MAG: hypothetical protein CfP315_0355 [Candidatus Improbicoccus pseudotrichonymphae]